MANNSPVYWSVPLVGGTAGQEFSLHTYAWSVKSFGGQRFAGPAKRGENLIVPFRTGDYYVPKSRGSRLMDLTMWVIPHKPSGGRDTDMSEEERAHLNYLTIMRNLDREGQYPLTKRWYEDGVVKSATGDVEFISGTSASSDDALGFDLTATLSMADPYFYGPSTVLTSIADMEKVAGQVNTSRAELHIPGGATVSFPDGNWIKFEGTGTAVVDLYNKTAKVGSTYVNGLIKRNTLMAWPELIPGAKLTVSGGSASVKYQPAYR